MAALNSWQEGLCGCCNDIGICCKGACCPCVLYGQNAQKLDGSGCLSNCLCYMFCYCLTHPGRRKLLREKYHLAEEPCNDCCVVCCCTTLAVCQEAREMEKRGPPPQQGMH